MMLLAFFQVARCVNSCLNLSLFPVRGVFQETNRCERKVEGKGSVNKRREIGKKERKLTWVGSVGHHQHAQGAQVNVSLISVSD